MSGKGLHVFSGTYKDVGLPKEDWRFSNVHTLFKGAIGNTAGDAADCLHDGGIMRTSQVQIKTPGALAYPTEAHITSAGRGPGTRVQTVGL